MSELRGVSAARALGGQVRVPGDKSISHRALVLGAMAEGSTLIEGLAAGRDVRSTWACLQDLGVRISSREDRTTVKGLGWRGLKEPRRTLEAGNSGTTMRLLLGALAGHSLTASLSGDESLCRRPMGRLAEPLRAMGATVELFRGDFAPLTIRGGALSGIDFVSPVASAQVKSAVLLAGLLATGKTSVAEPVLSRDHTERMLPLFGVPVERKGLKATVTGGMRLAKAHVIVPGDLSSAAFWVVAATLVPGSELVLPEVGLNPTRAGFLNVLERMGAKIQRNLKPPSVRGGEPVGDLVVRAASLKAADISPQEVPTLIDEVPILALAASQAKGTSRFKGLSELRAKESDRLQCVVDLLADFGGEASVQGDDLVIAGPRSLTGVPFGAGGDHRIAMTALIAGLIARGQTSVRDADCIDVSYPSFYEDLKRVCGL